MSSLGTGLAVAGGVGLVFAGLALATEGVQTAAGRALARALPGAAVHARRAFGLGLAAAVAAPASRAQPAAVVGFASGGGMRLGSALWAALGAGFAVVATGWAACASVVLAGSGIGLELGLALGGAGLWLLAAGRTAAWSRWLLGWAAFGIGVQWMAGGFEGATLRLDGLDLSLPVRVAVLAAIGAALAAALRSGGAVVAFTGCAAAGGALELTSAAALAVGAQAGAGLGVLWSAGSERGDGRRATVGLALQQALHAPLGLVLLAVCLPFFGDLPRGLEHPMVALCAFQTLVWVAGVGVYAPFHRLAPDALDQLVPAEEGSGSESLDLPDLALLGSGERVERIAAIVRSMARNVLARGRASDFRVESDLDQADLLAAEVAAIHARLAPRRLLPDQAERSGELARRARVLRLLLAELVGLRPPEQLVATIGGTPLDSRLRQVELGTVHLLDRCCAPRSREPVESLEGEWQAVERHRVDLGGHLVRAAAQGAVATDLVVALLGRLSALDRALRGALELADVDAPRPAPGLRERLAGWLVRGGPRAPLPSGGGDVPSELDELLRV